MKKINKKGFTIVELVIVIAVVAILAAVLIPTFAGIIEKANESSDIQLARNLNTALATSQADGKATSVNEAFTALAEQGFLVGNLNPSQEGNYFAWDSKSNQIIYIDGDDTSKPLYATNSDYGTVSDWWIPVSTTSKIANDFSNFILTEDDNATSLEFDKPIGLSVMTGKTLFADAIDIAFSGAGKISLDGNITATVTVDAPDADLDINENATVSNLVINSIGSSSAHIYGFVNELTHKAGRLVVENQGYVLTFKETATSSESKVEIAGVIQTLDSVNQATYEIKGGHILSKNDTNVTELPENVVISSNEDYSWKIGSVADLIRFREAVNAGYNFDGTTVELTADLDLSNMNWLSPIGNAITYISENGGSLICSSYKAFSGIFDGKNHTIKGLTIHNLVKGGYGGGLFGYCVGATVKNLNMTDVDISSDVQSSPLAGYMGSDSVVENVRITGTCKSQWTGGVTNYANGMTIKDCVINIDFIAEGYDVGYSVNSDGSQSARYVRLGGLVGQSYSITILNTDVSACTFTLVGCAAKVGYFVGGYLGQHNSGTALIDYDKDGVAEATVKGTSNDGDSDPRVVGIETITYDGITENIDLWTNYHVKYEESAE